MKRRQEAAEEAERQRLQFEADAKAAAEAQAEAARQAEAANRDSADAPGSPHSSREHEAGKCYLIVKLRPPPPFFPFVLCNTFGNSGFRK